jgi:hydroxyacylglutathione hydrolase
MLLRYFYDESLAQASYLIGCQASGTAAVIDPAREVGTYLAAAAREGLRITHALETHIHADFVSGARELAAHGTQVCVSAHGGPDWQTAYDAHRLHDGAVLMIGNLRVEALHTPGHTPEHLCYLLTDTKAADRPMALFSGDCLFVGDVGRPDLLDLVAGAVDTRIDGARQQFANLQRLKALPDYLQVLPAHGAGSACGKALGAVPSSTLGYEKLFNRAFQFDDEQAFIHWLLDGQPEAPRYFAQMKRVNRDGPALLADVAEPLAFDPTVIDQVVGMGALVIDTRPIAAFAQAHIVGTVNIPADQRSFSTWAGWYMDYNAPTYLIADPHSAPQIIAQLRAIGVDNLPGYFSDSVAAGVGRLAWISAQDVAAMPAPYILDVRGAQEYADGHLPHAVHLPMGDVLNQLARLPRDQQIIVQCGGGYRSQVVASLLQARGYTVASLQGGIDAWRKAGLATVHQ